MARLGLSDDRDRAPVTAGRQRGSLDSEAGHPWSPQQNAVLRAQQTHGNQAVQRLLGGVIQRDFWDDAREWGAGAAGAVGGLLEAAGSALPRVSGDVHLGSDGLAVSGSVSSSFGTVSGSLAANESGVTGSGTGRVGGHTLSGEGSLDRSGHGAASGDYAGSLGTLSGRVSNQGAALSGSTRTWGGTELSGSGEVSREGASGSLHGAESDGDNWSVSGTGTRDPRTWSGAGEYRAAGGSSFSGRASGSGDFSVDGNYQGSGGSGVSGSASRSNGEIDWDIDGHL
jgi:hypothetical protein